MKIPEALKKAPRCPLCYAVFAEPIIPARIQNYLLCAKCDTAMRLEKTEPNNCPTCNQRRTYHTTDGKAFMCYFCKIAIMANDPMVGQWERVYAQGEKIFCPNCDHEMRFFCTSTGYVQMKCPMRKCQAKMETTLPDRKEGETALFDDTGAIIAPLGIDRPVATPDAPAISQVGGSGKDENLPDEIVIPKEKLQ